MIKDLDKNENTDFQNLIEGSQLDVVITNIIESSDTIKLEAILSPVLLNDNIKFF